MECSQRFVGIWSGGAGEVFLSYRKAEGSHNYCSVQKQTNSNQYARLAAVVLLSENTAFKSSVLPLCSRIQLIGPGSL